MPNKKKQHYIPKFYLKFFSNLDNLTHVGLLNLKTNKYVGSASIDGQNKEDYFYGNETEIEDALAVLENKTCEIIQNKNLPPYDSEDYVILLVYVMYQQNRTIISAQRVNDLLNQVSQMLQNDRLAPENEIADVKFEYNYPGIAAIEVVSELIPVVSDLKCKLIINKTKELFITSDDPVVKWNQFLNIKKHRDSKTGLAMRGLKLFFPISPTITLLYYDSDIYEIGIDDSNVELFSLKDVRLLNLIQTFSCNENIYFNQEVDESCARRLLIELNNLITKTNNHIENYCKTNNCTVSLNDMQFCNLILDQFETLSFIKEKSQLKDIVFSKPYDFIRPSAKIHNEDSELTEKIFFEAIISRILLIYK